MTAPDSRDSVERVVAEMREELSYSVHVVEVSVSAFRAWADRLQALARVNRASGSHPDALPDGTFSKSTVKRRRVLQQAGGEDWPKVMGEYLAIMTRCDDAIHESGKATLSRADMEAIERYNLADEHLSMMQADRIAALQAEVARLREILLGYGDERAVQPKRARLVRDGDSGEG